MKIIPSGIKNTNTISLLNNRQNTSVVTQLPQHQLQAHQQSQQQPQQVLLQTMNGKPIVLNQQALQKAGITNLSNVRIVQSHSSQK